MAGFWGFLGSFFSFALLLLKEFMDRESTAAQAARTYAVDQAEFQAIASTVLTRLRLQAALQSMAAKLAETQVDASLDQRKKDP